MACCPLQNEYDTFGASATEAARSKAQREAADQRPSLIPGRVMDELVETVADSKGGGLFGQESVREESLGEGFFLEGLFGDGPALLGRGP